jgi:hypothetical protein
LILWIRDNRQVTRKRSAHERFRGSDTACATLAAVAAARVPV